MSELINFRSSHLEPLSKEPLNAWLSEWIDSPFGKSLESIQSKTFIYKGEVMVCGGITPYWSGRGQLWTVFSEKSKHNFVPVFRVIKKWLNSLLNENYRRIELSVDIGCDVGKRRAEMLGFYLETELARQYLPDGKDVSIYSLVRGQSCHRLQ
jgi:hypothetical protein